MTDILTTRGEFENANLTNPERRVITFTTEDVLNMKALASEVYLLRITQAVNETIIRKVIKK